MFGRSQLPTDFPALRLGAFIDELQVNPQSGVAEARIKTRGNVHPLDVRGGNGEEVSLAYDAAEVEIGIEAHFVETAGCRAPGDPQRQQVGPGLCRLGHIDFKRA